VNDIVPCLLLGSLDQEDRGEDEKSTGQGSKPNIAEEVSQKHEERHQAKAKPARHAAHRFSESHDQLRMVTSLKSQSELESDVGHVTRGW
jgi:hypothetical protein